MSFENPFTVLFDQEGTALAVSESQSVTSSQPGIVVFGSGSTGFEYLRLSDSGELFVTGTLSADLQGAVDQGNAGTIGESWYVRITDGTNVIGTEANPFAVSGTVDIGNDVTVNGTVTVDDITNPINIDTTTPLDVTGTVGVTSIASPVSIDTSTPLDVTGTVGITSIASPVTTRPVDCTSTVVTGWAASTTNGTVLASNTSRCNAVFYMDGNATAYLKLGSVASTTSFTVKLGRGAYYELPSNYTGQIDVVFNKNNSNQVLRVTEINE